LHREPRLRAPRYLVRHSQPCLSWS
jgi:hypothetical protein